MIDSMCGGTPLGIRNVIIHQLARKKFPKKPATTVLRMDRIDGSKTSYRTYATMISRRDLRLGSKSTRTRSLAGMHTCTHTQITNPFCKIVIIDNAQNSFVVYDE